MLKSNRRKFIVAASVLTAGVVTNARSMTINEEKFIAHQVYFWLKNPASAEDKAKLIEGIKTLSKIREIKKLSVGVVAATEKRPVIDDSWSVSELAFFDDVAGEAAYQVHPVHVDFVKNYSHLWSKVVIYDSAEI